VTRWCRLTISNRLLINDSMLRIALRMLLDQPAKSLGTLLGVIVSTFLMAQQIATLLGILGRVAAFADGTDVDVWITSPTTQSSDITDTVPMDYRSRVASTPGVAWVAPVVQGMSRAVRADGARELVKVVGVETPRLAGLARTLVDGTERSDLALPGRILLSAMDRPLYGPARRGDRVEIGGRTMIVAGFFDGIDPHGNYSFVFATSGDARALLGMPADRATFLAVGARPGERPEDLAVRLRGQLPDARIFTKAELRRVEIDHFMERTPVGLVFGMGTVVAALVGSLIVGVTMFSSVVDRTRELATLLAIGASRGDLLRLLLSQATIFFLVGAGAGLSIFGVVKLHATSAPMLSPPWMLAVVALTSLASCLLASLAAIRRVVTIDPAIVFRG
jgi:putative ABC transport system permease protein